MNLAHALNGYIECALTTENGGGNNHSYRHQDLTRDNIVPDTIVGMRVDVARFIRETQEIVGDTEVESYDFGYDFWATRNCRENKFWEQRHLSQQQLALLTKHAHTFGGYSLDRNDQGELYGHRS
jgi:hypothetical protein